MKKIFKRLREEMLNIIMIGFTTFLIGYLLIIVTTIEITERFVR